MPLYDASISAVDISQSLVWTHTRSVVTRKQSASKRNAKISPDELQNACLLFAKIAAEASLRCITITDYDTFEPLGRGMSFDVVGMNPPMGAWFRNSSVQTGARLAIKRIRVGNIDNEGTASRLRPFLKSMIQELQILTHPPIKDHLNIVSCRAVGYQNFSYETSYLAPFIAVEYTNWTTLGNSEIFEGSFGLKHNDKINCLVDVARALRFLHEVGVTHGDIKGDNILVYSLDLDVREYVGITRYFLAKVTDFGCAHIHDGNDARLPGGTPIWSAPEAQDLIAANLLSKTDMYSYGLLVCSVMLEQNLYSCFDLDGDRHEQRRNLDILKRNDTLLEYAERTLRSKNVLKKDVDNTVQVLRRTLLLDPHSRTLDTLEDFFKPRHGEIRRTSREIKLLPSRIPRLHDIDELSLFISLDENSMQTTSKFFDTDWVVQSYIAQNLTLEWENKSTSNFRRGYTAFQLCICYLNGFGVRPSKTKASEFLDYAVSLGCTYAQHLFYKLKKYISGISDPSPLIIQWLVEGMSSHGFTRHAAARDLASIDKEEYDALENQLYFSRRVRNCAVEGMHLDFNDMRLLRQVIETLPRPHSSVLIGDSQDTLLHRAVISGSVDALKLLLQKSDIDKSICNSLGETPLLLASQAGSVPMVKLLVDAGAKYVPGTKENFSPLHYLLRFSEKDIGDAALVLSKAGYPIDMEVADSGTPLFWAVARRALRKAPTGLARNNLEAVKLLLKLGANIYHNSVEPESEGGLFRRPAMLHDFELLKVLLEGMKTSRNKASPRVRLLRFVLNVKSFTTFERIIHMGPKTDMKLQNTIDLVLEYEKDIESINGLGESALFYSIASGNSEIVQHLVSTKCLSQLNQPSGREKLRPLELAVSLSAIDIMRTLLEVGANISGTSGKLEETCLHLCSRKSGSIEVATLLLQHFHGSATEMVKFIDKPRKDGRTAYHLAILQGHFGLADWYIKQGANQQAPLYIITWTFQANHRVLPQSRILGDYHTCVKQSADWIYFLEKTPSSFICHPVTILGAILPYKTEHTMSRLEGLFNPQRQQKPAFIVSPELQLSALHFAVAELYESFDEYRSRIGNTTPTLLHDAPLALALEKFSSPQEINHVDKNGWTAMHIAAFNSNVQGVTQILDAGGDPNLLTKRGWTVLDCAHVAKAKWSQSHSISNFVEVTRAHVANLGCLRARSNAIVELLESRGALRKQKSRFLTVVKANLSLKEWGLYTYLDATKS